jgi:Zinc dependent phospholipase C
MRHPILVVLTALVLGVPRPAQAWGFEGHKFITARVIQLLPPDIRPFFEKFRDVIVEHSIDPDLWRTAGWELESLQHFVDLDAYGVYPFRELPHDYDQAVQRYGRDFVEKNGLLPWRTQEMYAKLVEAFMQKGAYSRENVKFFSSVVSHYVADAHVPFHAALNHDGQLTGQTGIHARFETDLLERYRNHLTLSPPTPVPVPNTRDLVFAALTDSFSLVQPVLDADKAAVAGRDVYDDKYFELFFAKVRPILERRLSDSIGAVASVITAAWVDAGRPPLPLEQPKTPRKVRR